MKTLLNKKLAIISLALVCVLVGTLIGNSIQTATVSAETVVVTSPFTAAIQSVHKSVVGINKYGIRSSNSFGDFGFGFGFGFDNNRYKADETEVLIGAGSGVVVDPNGFVLTNHHVISDNTRLEVVVDEKTYPAELVAFDELKDIALLKVNDLKLPAVKLGDSDKLNVGDWAICIGNPISLPGTTTVGIISAINRKIPTSSDVDRYGKRLQNFNQMIQTDAAINSGNSGGGLFNVSGELMGIPTLKYANSIFSSETPIDGIGMAIPINDAKDIINKAIKGEKVEIKRGQTGLTAENKPRIGVRISDINANSLAVVNGVIPLGVSIREVEKNSPAEKSGLLKDDIVVDIDGNVIKSSEDMIKIISEKNAGDSVNIKVYRVEGLSEYTDYNKIPEGTYMDFDVKLEMLDQIQQ